MWTATITGKQIVNGSCAVNVEYTNGTELYNETHTVTSQGVLNEAIKSRIIILGNVEALHESIVLGAYTPIVKEPEPKDVALYNLSKGKQQLELGIISTVEYDALLTTFKDASVIK